MSYGGPRRGYNDDLAYGDDYGPPGGVQRWDRNRFESVRNRGGPQYRESVDYREQDRYGGGSGYRGGGGGSRDIEYDERAQRSSGPRGTRYAEEDRFYESDRYGSRRQPDFMYERNNDVAGKELAPYRDRWEYDQPRSRGSQRPGMIRRQSSWDGYDRRPQPNYANAERDIDVKIKVNEPQGYRRDYDEGYRERDRYDRYSGPSVYEEDYRDFRIKSERERSVVRRTDYRYEEDDYDRPSRTRKRGKTKMPKRLCHRKAIVDMGLPFEEDEYFFMVQYALNKDEIDDVIKISESYFREERSYTDTKLLEAPPSRSEAPDPPQPQETEIVETHTTRIIENPTDEEIARYNAQVSESNNNNNDNSGSGNGRDYHEDENININVSEYHDNDGGGGGGGGGSTAGRGRSDHSRTNVNINIDEHEDRHDDNTSQAQEYNYGQGGRSQYDNNALSPVDSRHSRRGSRSQSKSTHHQRSRSSHVVRGYDVGGEEVVFEESNNIGGPLGALVLTDRRKSRGSGYYGEGKSDRDIKAEIKALEAEKDGLKREREAEERRRKAERKYQEEIRKIDGGSTDDKDVVRVEKDRRGRLSLVRSGN